MPLTPIFFVGCECGYQSNIVKLGTNNLVVGADIKIEKKCLGKGCDNTVFLEIKVKVGGRSAI